MPEGPEVRRCRDIIAPKLELNRIAQLASVSGKLHRTGIRDANLCNGQHVKNVRVKGKAIFIELEDRVILSTLGMSGWWYPMPDEMSEIDRNTMAHYSNQEVRIGEVIDKAFKYNRAKIVTDRGGVFYSDPRNFGNISVVSFEEAQQKRRSLGIDVLNEPFDFQTWENAFVRHNPRAVIGEALLDQSFIAGVGNMYRAEILYVTGISPYKLVGDLTDVELQKLMDATYEILWMSYKNHGLMNYTFQFLEKVMPPVRFNATLGYLATIHHRSVNDIYSLGYCSSLLVYGRKTTFAGEEVKRLPFSGRTLWYVD